MANTRPCESCGGSLADLPDSATTCSAQCAEAAYQQHRATELDQR
ncbi:hypothetical protein B0I33_105329 [Prauserella shujinwangii]|uniref:Uncharacterized protein n=1 Tax=Prauserella shujinwangii TaxID=1453103 RepID=A0A2T0LVB8_9PSEU|nr:hypothetical protein [Prauserella shujinwangii]PRX47747.1 hypothetical protein B0I33_105329 [Prauserella shujinwangii]